jgi:hypothetical protein
MIGDSVANYDIQGQNHTYNWLSLLFCYVKIDNFKIAFEQVI